jgi:hypothetical protein
MSEFENLLMKLLNGETADIIPQSRVEQYLKNCCDKCGCDGLPTPQTRAEALLYQLSEQLAGGGGGDEVSDLDAYIEGTLTDFESKAKVIKKNSFGNHKAIANANFPEAYYIEGKLFYDCSNLESVKMPNVVARPSAISSAEGCFYQCSKLKFVDYGFVPYTNYLFDRSGSDKLDVVLRRRKVESISASPKSQLYANCELTLYVPKALIEQYKVATNWSEVDDFKAIEDYPEICEPNNFNAETAMVTSVTSLTASTTTKVGDLVVACIVANSDFTLSDGWTLVSTSIPNSTDSSKKTLSWAYKFAESEEETLTVNQSKSSYICVNLISFTGATGVVANGYQYKNNTDTVYEFSFDYPNDDIVLWGATASVSSYGDEWKSDNDAILIQHIDGTKPRPRLLNALDNRRDGKAQFKTSLFYGVSGAATFGSLTIKGVKIFGVG